jgi:hypothetical protein
MLYACNIMLRLPISQQVGTLSNDLNGSPERVYDPTVNA